MVYYDDYYSCNSCGGLNHMNKILYEECYLVCEVDTTCTECKFNDYWAYGFFESGKDGFNKSEKYSFS